MPGGGTKEGDDDDDDDADVGLRWPRIGDETNEDGLDVWLRAPEGDMWLRGREGDAVGVRGSGLELLPPELPLAILSLDIDDTRTPSLLLSSSSIPAPVDAGIGLPCLSLIMLFSPPILSLRDFLLFNGGRTTMASCIF